MVSAQPIPSLSPPFRWCWQPSPYLRATSLPDVPPKSILWWRSDMNDCTMITGLNHVTFAVRDLDESFDFYCSVLGLRPVFRGSYGVYLLAGDFWIALIEDSEGRPGPLPDYSHVAFSVQASNFESMSQNIRTSGATIWQKNTSE